jgi:signal transduction histidine kinase
LLKNSTAGLTDLIGDILSYVQLDQDQASSILEPFSLRATLLAAIDAHTAASATRGLTIELDIAADAADGLDGHAFYVSKVFGILIDNAVKFSSQGKIAIAIREESLGRFSSRFCCSVSDQGIGIPAELQEKMFEPFVQADSSNTRNFAGLGLGLAIAKRMVELMGGAIRVESAEGVGSTFSFTFYCHLQEAVQGAQATGNV